MPVFEKKRSSIGLTLNKPINLTLHEVPSRTRGKTGGRVNLDLPCKLNADDRKLQKGQRIKKEGT